MKGNTRDRIARIERMLEHYRLMKKRRLLRRAMALFREVETHQKFLDFEKPIERIH